MIGILGGIGRIAGREMAEEALGRIGLQRIYLPERK